MKPGICSKKGAKLYSFRPLSNFGSRGSLCATSCGFLGRARATRAYLLPTRRRAICQVAAEGSPPLRCDHVRYLAYMYMCMSMHMHMSHRCRWMLPHKKRQRSAPAAKTSYLRGASSREHARIVGLMDYSTGTARESGMTQQTTSAAHVRKPRVVVAGS